MIDKHIHKLEWEEKYSVGVEEIDTQHKKMFEIINELIDTATNIPSEESLSPIINALLEYRTYHFATEEKYFKEFNYDGAEKHIAEHIMFGKKVEAVAAKNKDDVIALTFDLLDFLEDWLVNHILSVDQQYKSCFVSHGLK
jgi:hemerythrin